MNPLLRLLLVILAVSMGPATAAPAPLTPAEARTIAKEAYIYGFPLVDNYRINHAYFVDQSNPEFKAPWNRITNTARVFTPEDKAIQTPNSDTPYSFVGMDLRAEPLVLTLPKVEASRYYSVQLIDAYTFNYAYLGTRSTGNEGGAWLIAGPRWKGTPPKGIKGVIRSESDFGYALVRTQLFAPDDIEKVKQVQAGYKVQTLSQFLGKPAPAAGRPVQWIKPLTAEQQKSSLDFYRQLNFVLQAAPTHPSEKALFERFARINVGPGRNFDPAKLSPEMRSAIEAGMADAWKAFNEYKTQEVDTGKVGSGDFFGTREFLKNDYMRRMTGAVLGIYGNSREEAIYPVYFVDSAGQKLDGAKSRYTLRFAPGQLPPAGAFWSITMYEQPASLLYANPLKRYLINSTMLPQLKRDADGGVTLLLQHESPGKELEANWLPAPQGPFSAILRLYLPKPEALDGRWKAPPLQAVATSGAAPGSGSAAPAATAVAASAAGSAGTVPVTPETYIRAETDRSFNNVATMAGGVNKLFHFRAPTPLDKQTVVRMNKDTLYSTGVIDTAGGATITLPDVPKDRYMSLLVIDNDHYAPAVFHGGGTYKLPSDTKYVSVIIRTQLFNPDDPQEVALVNKLQDRIVVNAKSADPLPPMRWDPASLKTLTAQYEEESKKYPSWKGMMGPRGTVDEKTRHIAAAAAWGLNPEEEAAYLNYTGTHDASVCHRATYRVPENKAFWSITVYGSDGYMKSANAIINSSTVKLNPDGTFTVYFGSREACGDVPNRVDVSEGWNFLMRVYLPGKSVLDGSYKLPAATPVSNKRQG
jgi:hypothetical protein